MPSRPMTKKEWSDAIRKIVEPPKPKKHRHERTSWLIAGGNISWCYQCGAWRQMAMYNKGVAYAPGSKWEKPTGIGGPNPAMKK